MKERRTQLTHAGLVASVVEFLRLCGHWAWSNKTTGTWDAKRGIFRRNTTYRGAADVIAVHLETGRHLEFEIKIGTDRLSDEQQKHASELRGRKAGYWEIRSIDDLLALRKLGEI